MRYILFGAIGIAFTSYGFSSGANLPNNLGLVIGWVGAAVTFIIFCMQYRDSLPYEHQFVKSDWQAQGSVYFISIPMSSHKKTNGVAVAILEKTADSFEQVLCGNGVQPDGTVQVFATDPFIGKVLIR